MEEYGNKPFIPDYNLLGISENDLKEAIDFNSRIMVGKLMAEIELCPQIHDNQKKRIKDIIYQCWRDFSYQLSMYTKGIELSTIIFTNRKKDTQ